VGSARRVDDLRCCRGRGEYGGLRGDAPSIRSPGATTRDSSTAGSIGAPRSATRKNTRWHAIREAFRDRLTGYRSCSAEPYIAGSSAARAVVTSSQAGSAGPSRRIEIACTTLRGLPTVRPRERLASARSAARERGSSTDFSDRAGDRASLDELLLIAAGKGEYGWEPDPRAGRLPLELPDADFDDPAAPRRRPSPGPFATGSRGWLALRPGGGVRPGSQPGLGQAAARPGRPIVGPEPNLLPNTSAASSRGLVSVVRPRPTCCRRASRSRGRSRPESRGARGRREDGASVGSERGEDREKRMDLRGARAPPPAPRRAKPAPGQPVFRISARCCRPSGNSPIPAWIASTGRATPVGTP